MPLLALDTKIGQVLDATAASDDVWAAVWRARTGPRLRCRTCDAPVHAKARSSSGLRFFAHTTAVPDCPRTGESAKHLHLKGRFAAAFRAAGWVAELEVDGPGWRADVLVHSPDGARRYAVEVQLASIAEVDVAERTRRHEAAGVTTIWVLSERRPGWAQTLPSVVIDADGQVTGTVLVPARPSKYDERPRFAPAASIELFARRLAEGRLAPIPLGPVSAWRTEGVDARSAWQLDGCARAWETRELQRRERVAAQARNAEARERAHRAVAVRRNEEMAASLEAFRAWFSERHPELQVFFGGGHRTSAAEAVERTWKPRIGIVVCIGRLRATEVVALAEPGGISPRIHPWVMAWTVAPQVPTWMASAFPVVLGPTSTLDPLERPLKPVPHPAARRRR